MRDWRVVQQLGEGRHCTLYAVERAGRPFVLKWLASRGSEPPRVLAEREASCLRLLQGPLFAHLEAQGLWPEEEWGTPFLVLESIPGGTLADWYHRPGPTAHDMVVVFERITAALSQMHRKGVRYPTLTSSDVRMRGGRREPVLADLGGAFLSWEALTPEQIGEDMWSLGAMLYEALTHQRPGPNAPPPRALNPRIPVELSQLTMRLLLPGPAPRARG